MRETILPIHAIDKKKKPFNFSRFFVKNRDNTSADPHKTCCSEAARGREKEIIFFLMEREKKLGRREQTKEIII